MPRRAADREEANQIAERIGDRVRGARASLEITQEELSERIGITSEALGRIERAAALPSFPTFLRLCHAVGMSPSALLGESQEGKVAPLAPAHREQKGDRQLVRLLGRLDARQQRLLLAVSRELLRSSQRRRELTPGHDK